MTRHAFNQRILAEDLVRVRRPDDLERYAASQRQARIDPNPHQIDAVIFALRRLREGGCILADEVGLGKTIEAGLVIAQNRAEGAQRILLIVPKSLIGQWQNELANLFGVPAQDDQRSFVAPGVYLVGREFAGGRHYIAERALKLAIRHRNNSLFYRSERGARVGDIYMTLIHTTELQGENPFHYLTELMRHESAVAEEPAAWLPWNYRDTLARFLRGRIPARSGAACLPATAAAADIRSRTVLCDAPAPP